MLSDTVCTGTVGLDRFDYRRDRITWDV